jgi:hypothetical protein
MWRAERSYLATVYGDHLGAGELGQANIKRFHNRLRQRLRRAGVATTVIFGGTEVAWKADSGQWLLHVHLLAIDPPEGALEALAEKCRGDDQPGAPATKFRLVTDAAPVATYLQKFQFYHHPGKRTGATRPRAVPLPTARAIEFAEFLIRRRFQDFLFLSGCRRRGHRIVPLATKRP